MHVSTCHDAQNGMKPKSELVAVPGVAQEFEQFRSKRRSRDYQAGQETQTDKPA